MASFVSVEAHAAKIGAGIGRTVEFAGSNDYTFIPRASFELETGIGIFKNNELGVQLDLIKSGAVDTGPILRINLGRNDSVSDPLVAALPEIEVTAEAGWFVGSGVKLDRLGLNTDNIVIGSVKAVTDVGDGHGGTLLSASLGLVMPINEQLRMVPSVTLNYADDNYMQSFYGVSPNKAGPDGFMQFDAKGGLESSQLALVVIRTIDTRWSVTGVFAQNVLQGDAKASPITERGSDKNLFAGFTASYTF